jgi:hypothetical protein
MDITVTMSEDEIIHAIKNYMADQDVVTLNKEVEVNLVAGRGVNGHSAVISIKGSAAINEVTHLGSIPCNTLSTEPKELLQEGIGLDDPTEPEEVEVTRRKRGPNKPKSIVEDTHNETVNLFTDAVEEDTVSDNDITEDIMADMPVVESQSMEVESLFG